MAVSRFSSGTQFTWMGQIFEIVRRLQNQRLRIENESTGDEQVVEESLLLDEYSAGNLRFKADESGNQNNNEERIHDSQSLDLSDYPTNLVDIARYRLGVIEPLIAIRPNIIPKKVVKARVSEIREENDLNEDFQDGELRNSISVSSVYRWIKRYEQSGNDLRALIPDTARRGGKGKRRLDTRVEIIIESVINDMWYRREKVTGRDLHHEIAVRIAEENKLQTSCEQLYVPSLPTIYERLKDLDAEQVYRAQHGNRASKRKFSQFGRMDFPKQPLEEVEMDFTRVDLIVVDEEDYLPLGRPTVGLVLDLATRYPLGYYLGFEPESYLAVMEALHHSILLKTEIQELYPIEHNWLAYGIPQTISLDNSKAFRSEALKDACLSLGITLKHGPPRTPHLRGSIERLFRSTTALFHSIPGTTFSSVTMRGDYQSEEQACISLQDIEKMLVTFLVDVYAQKYHRGLGDIPAHRWEEAIAAGFMPRIPPSIEDLFILLGRVEYRTVQHYGIDLYRIRYNSPELVPLRTMLKKNQNLTGKKVKVKYHPGDLSRIFVLDPFEKRYIEVPALDQDYTQGLSLWKHRVILRFSKETEQKVDLAALGRAKRKLREIVKEGKRRKRISGRSRIARYEQSRTPQSQQEKREISVPNVNVGDDKTKPHLHSRETWILTEPLDEPVEDGWSVELPSSRKNDKDKHTNLGVSNG